MRKSKVSHANKNKSIHDFKVGDKVVYWPIKKVESDNIHWNSEITAIGERMVSLLVSTPDGLKKRSVSLARIVKHGELTL